MSNPNFEVWKEPRGFLKCLEVFLAIFAFSCATGFRGALNFSQDCNGTSHKVDTTFKYPFDSGLQFSLMKTHVNCSTTDVFVPETVPLNERHSTEFFVVIGVFCFLLSAGMLLYYIYFEDVESKQHAKASGTINWFSGPILDFSLAVFFAFFWFVSSIAQAAAVNGIKAATNVDSLAGKLANCQGPLMQCHAGEDAKYATLTVSILLGFLNTFVWCGNTWFLWKETPWHKEPQNTAVPAQPHQQMPSAAI